MRQRPRCCCGRRDRHTHGQSEAREPSPHVFGKALLAAEQVRDSGDVEPECVRPIHLHQRRPAFRPARESLQQRRIAGRVGRNGDETGIERPRVGQACARACAALGGGCRDRMDNQPVRALDGEDNWCLRRRVGAFRPTLDREMQQPDGKHPCHARRSSGRAACLSRGTDRHPRRELQGRAGRAR